MPLASLPSSPYTAYMAKLLHHTELTMIHRAFEARNQVDNLGTLTEDEGIAETISYAKHVMNVELDEKFVRRLFLLEPALKALMFTKDSYVATLMQLVPQDEFHRGAFEADAKRMFDRGWDYADARAMFMLHEEISPELNETVACDAMLALQKKYGEA